MADSRLLINSKVYRDELVARNVFSQTEEYQIGHPNATSDGDEHGKGLNNGQVGGATDIRQRETLVSKNPYQKTDEYGISQTSLLNDSKGFRQASLANNNEINMMNEYQIGHPNATSDGDEKGKGLNNGNVGSATDIRKRKDLLSRNRFNKEREYNLGTA